MADAIVGSLRSVLAVDATDFDGGLRRAQASTDRFKKSLSQSMAEVELSMKRPEAAVARLAAAMRGDKLIQSANNIVAAMQKLGGATKLTETEQARYNVTLQKAIDKYRVLGMEAPKAMLDLERATRKAAQPLDQMADKSLTNVSNRSRLAAGAMGALSGQVATFVAGFAAFNVLQMASSGLVNLVKGAFESASALVDLSNKTGLSTETLQRMEFVAGQAGGTLEGFAESSYRLGIRLSGGSGSVRKAVQELGLDFARLQAMNPSEQFETIAVALGKISDATNRNRLGAELFSRTFTNVAGAIGDGYARIAEGATVLKDEQLRALDATADAWDKWIDEREKKMKSFFGAIVAQYEAQRAINASIDKMSADQRQRFFQLRGALGEAEASRLVLGKGRDVELPAAGSTAKTQSFVQQLAAVDAQLAKLTKTQHAEIAAAMELGVKQSDLEDQFGLTDGALGRYKSLQADATKETNAAAAATKKAEAEAKKYADELEKLNEAADKVGDSVYDINQKLMALADRQGDLEALETLNRVKGIDDFLRAEVDRQDALDDLADEDERRMAEDERRDAAHIQKRREMNDDALEEQARADAARADAFSQRWTDAAMSVMQVVAQAVAAGSSGMGAQNTALATGMAAISMVPGYGPLVAGTISAFTGAIDTKNEKVSGQTRAKIAYGDFLRMISVTTAAGVSGSSLQIRANKAVAASYIEIGLTAEDATSDLNRLHTAAGESAEAYNKALEHINENLRRQQDLTDARRQKQNLLNEAVERYGITWEEAGRLFQRGTLADQAEQLIQDWQLLVESGADPSMLAQRMGASASAFVQQAVKSGTEIPESMRPMLKEMESLGLLLDENGHNFRVEMLKFGSQLESMFERTLDRLNALIDELKRPPNTPIPRRSGPTVEAELEGRSRPTRMHSGRYIGSGEVPAILQTHEAVMNRAATRMLGGKTGVDAFNAGDPMAGIGAALASAGSPWASLPLGRTATTAAWSANSGGGAEGPVSVNATIHVHGIQDPAEVSREVARRLPMEISRNTHGVRSKLRRQLGT